MPVSDTHADYLGLLLDNVYDVEYPSHQFLDRIEAAIQTRADAEEYLEYLHSRVQHQHPSLRLIDRIARITSLLMLADRLEEQRAGTAD